MSDAQKTPLSRTLSSFTTAQALNEIQKRGSALPGHVASIPTTGVPIVTVNFDIDLTPPINQVTMPVFGAEYIRVPIQKGDLGVAFPVGAYVGGVSGLGGGVADDTLRGNLSTLVWIPVGNKGWSAVDGTAVVLSSANGQFTISIGNTGILMKNGATTLLQIDGSGNVTINSRVFLDHIHDNTAGSGGAGTYTAPGGGGLITGDSGAVV